MLKFLVKDFLDAYISKTIQGTCFIFDMPDGGDGDKKLNDF